MPAFIAKTVQAWAEQATAAHDALAAQLPKGAQPTLADMAKVDHHQFALLIEAMVALEPATGQKVAADLVQLAGLQPVDQVLGLP